MGNGGTRGDGRNSIDRPTREKEWANNEARLRLNDDDKAAWARMGYTVRPYVYYNKILVVWVIDKGQPSVKDVFKITGVDANFQSGLWVRTTSLVTNQETILNHSPRRLAADLDIFAWVPFFNEVRYISEDFDDMTKPRNMRLALCIKMPEDPRDTTMLRDGQVYLSELHSFRSQFPEFRHTFF